MAAAKLQQEGIQQVRKQVWEFVVLVHLFHEELDGAQRLQGEGLVDSTLTPLGGFQPLPLPLTIRGSTAARRQMSALEVAFILAVNLDCSRPSKPWSMVRAKGTFSATASHTSVRWLAKEGQGGWAFLAACSGRIAPLMAPPLDSRRSPESLMVIESGQVPHFP